MSEKLGDAILELKTDSKKFDKGIGKAEKRTGKLGGKLKRAGMLAKSLKVQLLAVGAAVLAGVGISRAIFKVTDLGDKIAKMAQKTGIATETLSSFRLVMNLGGTSIDSFAKGMKTISKMMFDIRGGAGAEAEKAFKAINVETENMDGSLRDVLDVFFDVADAFKNMKDGAEKAAVAQTILGRAGLELIPTLNMGSAEIRKQVQLAKDLGLQFSKLEGEQMEEFTDSVEVLSTAFFALWQMIVIKITPSLTKMIDKFVAGIKWFKEWRSQVKGMTAATFDFNKALQEQIKIDAEIRRLQSTGIPFIGGPKGFGEELNDLRSARFALRDVAAGSKEAEGALVDLDKEIKLKGEDLAEMADIGESAFDKMQNAVTGWASNFSSTLTDMLFGAKITFGSILEEFAKMLTQMMIQTQFIEPLLSGLSSIGSNAPRGGITGPPRPGLFGLGFLGLAGGGIVRARTGGTLIMAGEGGEDEVVAPLSKLERMGGNVEINIIGAPAGTRTEESTTANGDRRIDVILDEQMAGIVNTPGSKTNKALKQSYTGMSPTLIGRG